MTNRRPMVRLMLALVSVPAIFGIASPCALVQSAYAQASNEIVIKDSSGFVRSQTSVEDKGKVEFSVVDDKGLPKDGAVLVLLNEATGETITGTTVGGVAVFENITPGVWVISTTTQGIVFTSVAITGMGAAATGAGLTGGSLLALGGLAAGGTALGIAVNNSGDSNGTVISPSS